MIEKVFQYGGILVQKHVLTRYFGFYSDSHYQWYDERERERVFKGKRRGRERGKPEAAKEAEEDKPMRKGKSRRDKSLAPGPSQYHIVPKTGVQTSVLT